VGAEEIGFGNENTKKYVMITNKNESAIATHWIVLCTN
jgi:hypothetical protein